MQKHMHTHIHVNMHLQAHMHAHMYTHMPTRMHTCTHMYARTHFPHSISSLSQMCIKTRSVTEEKVKQG